MENIPKSLEKELMARTLPRPSKKNRQWNLLIVGDHGKIIPVKGFRALLIIAAIALIISISAAAAMFFIYKGTKKENKELADNLEMSRQKFVRYRDEKDMLMARLVLAESKIEEILAGETERPAKMPPKISSPPKTVKNSADLKKVALSDQPLPEETPAKVTPEKTPAMVTPGETVPQKKPFTVEVEELKVFREPESNGSTLQFLLRKTDPNLDIISGYAFVILKERDARQDQWLVLPAGDLSSGKPALINKGQYFSISRFKPMNFKISDRNDITRYKNAAVLIFTTKGESLMEKEFSVSFEKEAFTSTE